jgi:tetratricopeptide (TPR) repeat protein
LDSGDVDLFIRPVWIYIDQLKNPKKAMEWAKRAVTEHPNEAMSYNLMGWAQMANDDLEEAEQNLNYALVLDSKLAAAYLNFGVLYEKEGKLEQAKENYKRAYTLDPSGSVGNRAAENYNRLLSAMPESGNKTNTSTQNPPSEIAPIL